MCFLYMYIIEPVLSYVLHAHCCIVDEDEHTLSRYIAESITTRLHEVLGVRIHQLHTK